MYYVKTATTLKTDKDHFNLFNSIKNGQSSNEKGSAGRNDVNMIFRGFCCILTYTFKKPYVGNDKI